MRNTLVFLMSALFLLSGCTKKKQQVEFGLDINDTIRVNYLTEPPSLDWSKSTDTTSSFIEINIMDGLTEFDFSKPQLDVKPALAESWEPTNNARTWTFKIRKGVKWTDGVELTAQHFVDGWERLLRPTTASEYAYYLFGVRNARNYNEGKLKDFKKVGVTAVDSHTLKVELDTPRSYFPLMLTHHSTYPIRLDVVEKHGEDGWALPGKIVTLGAYVLERWEHDRIIHLKRNENYYADKAKTGNILVYMIGEQSTAVGLVDTGKLDFQSEVPKSDIRALRERDDYVNIPNFGVYYYGFNTKKPPFDDPRVRRAIGMAIDRQEIAKVLGGGEKPTKTIIPPGLLGYKNDVGLKFDPEAARALLKEAGYGEGLKALPKVTLNFNTNENHQLIAENVQAQLRRNISLNLELKNEEWKVYLKTLRTDNFGIFRMGWISDYPDPNDFMSLMLSYSENNRTKWKNKNYDSLVESAASELDPASRKQAYHKAQQILTEADAPIIPMYVYASNMLVSKRLKNFPVNEMRQFPLKGVEIISQ